MQDTKQKTVLLIDDETLVRTTIARMLERATHRVLQATNGVSGLKIFRREKIDLVVCDIIMPEMEGIQTIREIKRNNPSVKIIAVSGSFRTVGLDILPMAQKLGVDQILPKPFGGDELLSAVQLCFESEQKSGPGPSRQASSSLMQKSAKWPCSASPTRETADRDGGVARRGLKR